MNDVIEALKAAWAEIDNSLWSEGVFFGPDHNVLDKISDAIFKLTGERPQTQFPCTWEVKNGQPRL